MRRGLGGFPCLTPSSRRFAGRAVKAAPPFSVEPQGREE